jgi:hypothetical protein
MERKSSCPIGKGKQDIHLELLPRFMNMSGNGEYAAFKQYFESIREMIEQHPFPHKFVEQLTYVLEHVRPNQFVAPKFTTFGDSVSLNNHVWAIVDGIKSSPSSISQMAVPSRFGERLNGQADHDEAVQKAVNDFTKNAAEDPLGAHPKTNGSAMALTSIDLLPETANTLTFVPEEPPVEDDPRTWEMKPTGESLHVVATMIPTGMCTAVHFDDFVAEFVVWHLRGHKLWLVWDDTDENMEQTIWRKTRPGQDVDAVRWALDSLNGLKACDSGSDIPLLIPSQIYYTRATLTDMCTILVPPRAFHMVFTFSSSLHLSIVQKTIPLFIRSVQHMLRAHQFLESHLAWVYKYRADVCEMLGGSIRRWEVFFQDETREELVAQDHLDTWQTYVKLRNLYL